MQSGDLDNFGIVFPGEMLLHQHFSLITKADRRGDYIDTKSRAWFAIARRRGALV